MAWEGPVVKVPNLKASESLANYQYCFVYLSGTGTVAHCATPSVRPIGVLQNNPASGEEAEVVILGVTKIRADETLVVGDSIKVGNSGTHLGQAAKAGTGSTTPNLGTVLLGGAVDNVVTVTVNCLNQER